jgi:hypothetical protein
MKKLFTIVCFIFSFFTSNSFAQSQSLEDRKAEAEKEYNRMLGLTGKPEDIAPQVIWIAEQMVLGTDKFASRTWNKEDQYYELKIGTRSLRVYMLDKKQVKKISIIKVQKNVIISNDKDPVTNIEYEEIVGDSDGNVIEGAFAPSIKKLKTVKKTFTRDPEKKELRSWWQYELESEIKKIRTAFDTHKE